MTAITFRLHRLETGQHVAWALVCVSARYASLAVPGVMPLMRRFVNLATWREIEAEIYLGLNPGPLPATSPIAKVLAEDNARSYVVQYVTVREIDVAPLDVTPTLDSQLRSLSDSAA